MGLGGDLALQKAWKVSRKLCEVLHGLWISCWQLSRLGMSHFSGEGREMEFIKLKPGQI